jgi:hypothetical protein
MAAAVAASPATVRDGQSMRGIAERCHTVAKSVPIIALRSGNMAS